MINPKRTLIYGIISITIIVIIIAIYTTPLFRSISNKPVIQSTIQAQIILPLGNLRINFAARIQSQILITTYANIRYHMIVKCLQEQQLTVKPEKYGIYPTTIGSACNTIRLAIEIPCLQKEAVIIIVIRRYDTEVCMYYLD